MKRYIYTDADLQHFVASPAHKSLLTMVSSMGRACATRHREGIQDSPSHYSYDPSNPLVGLSPSMAALHGALRQMTTWVDEIQPVAGGGAVHIRFGNPAFRTWHSRLTERSYAILQCVRSCCKEQDDNSLATLEACAQRGYEAAASGVASVSSSGESSEESNKWMIEEMQSYFHEAFGQPIRLDYGTGHETCFFILLFCMSNLGGFAASDARPSIDRLKAIALSITAQYLKVTRTVQTVYRLEPAGSHGVWGLDDYHCLPFYLGACQLSVADEYSKPDCIHESFGEEEADQYLYLGCIRYIKSLKRGVPFFESSPMLNDISGLASWSKVSAGLLKMYEGENLNKRPVVQHICFGKLFPADWTPSHAPPPPPPTSNLFREGVPGATVDPNSVMPPTRAPWAK